MTQDEIRLLREIADLRDSLQNIVSWLSQLTRTMHAHQDLVELRDPLPSEFPGNEPDEKELGRDHLFERSHLANWKLRKIRYPKFLDHAEQQLQGFWGFWTDACEQVKELSEHQLKTLNDFQSSWKPKLIRLLNDISKPIYHTKFHTDDASLRNIINIDVLVRILKEQPPDWADSIKRLYEFDEDLRTLLTSENTKGPKQKNESSQKQHESSSYTVQSSESESMWRLDGGGVTSFSFDGQPRLVDLDSMAAIGEWAYLGHFVNGRLTRFAPTGFKFSLKADLHQDSFVQSSARAWGGLTLICKERLVQFSESQWLLLIERQKLGDCHQNGDLSVRELNENHAIEWCRNRRVTLIKLPTQFRNVLGIVTGISNPRKHDDSTSKKRIEVEDARIRIDDTWFNFSGTETTTSRLADFFLEMVKSQDYASMKDHGLRTRDIQNQSSEIIGLLIAQPAAGCRIDPKWFN